MALAIERTMDDIDYWMSTSECVAVRERGIGCEKYDQPITRTVQCRLEPQKLAEQKITDKRSTKQLKRLPLRCSSRKKAFYQKGVYKAKPHIHTLPSLTTEKLK